MPTPESPTPQNIYTILTTDSFASAAGMPAVVTAGNVGAASAFFASQSSQLIDITGQPRNALLVAYQPIIQACLSGVGSNGSNLAAGVAAKWTSIYTILLNLDPGTFVQYSWFSAVAGNPTPSGDNVLSNAQATALGQRAGTWAEYYFGMGQVVADADIVTAFRVQ